MDEGDGPGAAGPDRPDVPSATGSGLTLDEYLSMREAVEHPTCRRILRTLVDDGESSVAMLEVAVDVTARDFRRHLDELVDVGLVDERRGWTSERRDVHAYARPTATGTAILDGGIEKLLRREREFDDAYS